VRPSNRAPNAIAICAAAASLLLLTGTQAKARATETYSGVQPLAVDIDLDTRIDANLIDCVVTNQGSFGYDVIIGNAGLIYPTGGQSTALFASGFWLGAQVDGQTRVVVSEYGFEYGPGTIENGVWSDPADPSYRVYKIRVGDTPGTNIDYAEWPSGDGAPLDALGDPRHLADQTLWSVYNDLDPSRHTNDAGNSSPLGVEIQHSTFALDQIGPSGETMFMEWKIINKGSDLLEDTYVSIWSDPDLGGPGDDYVGCDPPASLGFCYNATNSDSQYGSSPPAIGMVFLQGPIVPSPGDQAYVSGQIVDDYRNLELASFNKYINGTDPSSSDDSYNYMQGLASDGTPIVDPTTGMETTFAVPGDPVTATGWIDSNPADRRMMLSAGPFTMAPGDTQVVAVAVVLGRGTDRLSSITEMRENADDALATFRALVEDAPGACCLGAGACTLVTATECAGEFRAGETCDPNPCSETDPGACCYPSGDCLVLPLEHCGGTFQGAGTVCDPNPCEPLGADSACCMGDGTCIILAELDCTGLGGTYVPNTDCSLSPPGTPLGWEINDHGGPMIDEIEGAGGVPVAPDGRGGPGDAVWHSFNSTQDWILSAGGGDGSFERFRRSEGNLTDDDLILRWDNDPDNYGWWAFDGAGQTAAQIPFGLYLAHPTTGVETRLIVILFSGGGTEGVYDISSATLDPFTSWPATDWAYAFTGDYATFLLDAADGTIDDISQGDSELFARLIFASSDEILPATGTVIQFTTRNGGPEVGSGFDGAIPLAWLEGSGIGDCFPEDEVYEVYRNETLLATTSRRDYLYLGAQNGEPSSFEIQFRNPVTDEVSGLSAAAQGTPEAGGFQAVSGLAVAAPNLDGIIDSPEWDNATVLPAADGGVVRVMNDNEFLYLAYEDLNSAEDIRLYIDSNANGTYDPEILEGVLILQGTEATFSGRSGVYPDAVPTDDVPDPSWTDFAVAGTALEMRLALGDGPLAERPGNVVKIYVHSLDGTGSYPPGPSSVLEQAPALFAAIDLSDATSSAPSSVRTRSFPNPMTGMTTIAYRIASNEEVAVEVFSVDGRLVRSLQEPTKQAAGTYALVWDGRTEVGDEAPSGVYFYWVRGETFEQRKQLTLIR